MIKSLLGSFAAIAAFNLCFAELREFSGSFWELISFWRNLIFHLAPIIKICSQSSPNLSECLKNAVENIRPLLRDVNNAPGFLTEGKEVPKFLHYNENLTSRSRSAVYWGHFCESWLWHETRWNAGVWNLKFYRRQNPN